MSTDSPLRIGLSARLMHDPPAELGFRNKVLHYLEQSAAHWILGRGALAFMVPAIGRGAEVDRRQVALRNYAEALDGLVLQGGADVSPQCYGQAALRPAWAGDPVRDRYELELIEAFLELGKPILGICRGCQLVNVAFGGSLYQDIALQRPDAQAHHDPHLYDELHHVIDIVPNTHLQTLYPDQASAVVSSIHHQGIDRLGGDLQVQALSRGDHLVEAVRARGAAAVIGVQWHPEFHSGRSDRFDPAPLMDAFLTLAQERRQ